MCVTSTAARRKRLFLGPSQNVFLCLSCEERRPVIHYTTFTFTALMMVWFLTHAQTISCEKQTSSSLCAASTREAVSPIVCTCRTLILSCPFNHLANN